jgi:hypothetical protein
MPAYDNVFREGRRSEEPANLLEGSNYIPFNVKWR